MAEAHFTLTATDAAAKTCSKCGATKPLTEYNRHSGSRDGLRGYCKSCHCAYSTQWIADNREHYNARIRRDRAIDPDKYHAWARVYRESDPERFAEIKRVWTKNNPDRRKATIRRYNETHVVENHQRARARQAAQCRALPAWADIALMEGFYRRAKELTLLTGIKHEVDHIYPLRGKMVCGLHCEANLQILTTAENRAKGNKMPKNEVEFRGKVFDVSSE